MLDAIERRRDDGPVSFQVPLADFVAEPVEPWKNPKQRSQSGIGLAAHARRQHAQRSVWIVPEQR
ncbi:MAG: hypothetical protein WBL96_14735, partial [Pseudolabrys sp.]